MNLVDIIRDEIRRQAGQELIVKKPFVRDPPDTIRVDGRIDLYELVKAIRG